MSRYQGWFRSPGDGSPLGAWEHWFRRGEQANAAIVGWTCGPMSPNWRQTSVAATPLTLPGGRQAELYSAFNPRTVDRHFRWMQEYDLAGSFPAAVHRSPDNPAVLGFRDGVARNVRSAAESHGRVFAIMYDISGHPQESLTEAVKRDWMYAVDTLRVTESPRYLRHRGRPLLAIWGFGFLDRSPTPEQAAELIEFFKNNPNPRYRVTLLGGIPARWRTLTRDSRPDPKWARVYRSFDVVSPWTIGRFRDADGIDRFYADEVANDLVEARRLGLDYMPVVFPRLLLAQHEQDRGLSTEFRAVGAASTGTGGARLLAGNTMSTGAMFDEVDEGTAMFKVAASARDARRKSRDHIGRGWEGRCRRLVSATCA